MIGAVAWQRAEGAAIFAAALLYYLTLEGFHPALALAVFFAPDLSFAAYLIGPRAGAAVYNLAHLYAVGIALALWSLWAGGDAVAALGLLLLAHAGFDRALGYGLKLTEGFKATHLGRLGGAAPEM